MRVQVLLALSYQQAGRMDEAVQAYERAANTPEDAVSRYFKYRTSALSNMAAVYLASGMLDHAEKAMLRITEPTAESVTNMAVIQLRKGKAQDALALIETGLEQWPNSMALQVNHKEALNAVARLD